MSDVILHLLGCVARICGARSSLCGKFCHRWTQENDESESGELGWEDSRDRCAVVPETTPTTLKPVEESQECGERE